MTVLRLSGINGCFEVCKAKFHLGVVLSVELWSFSVQESYLSGIFEFSEACLG